MQSSGLYQNGIEDNALIHCCCMAAGGVGGSETVEKGLCYVTHNDTNRTCEGSPADGSLTQSSCIMQTVCVANDVRNIAQINMRRLVEKP